MLPFAAGCADNSHMKRLSALLFLAAFTPCTWAAAKPRHDLADIRDTAVRFATLETSGLPGEITVKADEIDPRLNFAPCSMPLEAFLPVGALLRGKTTVGVRCNDKPGWSLFVPLTIRITLPILVSSHPLPQGKTLESDDFSLQTGEVNNPAILTAPEQAIGKILKFPLGAGQVLRQDMLRPPYVVVQGQKVVLAVSGNGFNIRSEGVALNNAAESQPVQVKVASGQIVNGVARADGSVEVKR